MNAQSPRQLAIATFLILFGLVLTGCASVHQPANSALLTKPKTQVQALAAPKPNPLKPVHYSFARAATLIEEEDPAGEQIGFEINDPNEKTNRKIFAINRAFDRGIVRPLSKLYGVLVPPPIRRIVRNELRLLEAPGDFINYTLQGNGKQARRTLKRMAINVTLGVGGIFDAAKLLGAPYEPTDFGLTLAKWGVGEGRYIVSPLFGPSTVRASIGRFVDIGLSPQTYLGIITDAPFYGAIATGVELVDRRYRNGELLDNSIYTSPDPYTTLRSVYLQRRRAQANNGFSMDDDTLPEIETAGR